MTLSKPTEIAQLSDAFLNVISIADRRYKARTYRNVFVGSETVDAMLDAGIAASRIEAVAIARRLEKELRLFSHVAGHHLFKDDYLFYRLSEKDGLSLTAFQFDPEELLEKAQQFRQLANIKDRKYRFKKYKKCFVGSEIIDAMVYTGLASSRTEALMLGRALEQHLDWFRHVTGDHHFKDDHLFYRFNVAADLISVGATSSISNFTSLQLSKPISSAPASTASSLSSSWSTGSGASPTSSARLQQQTKALMLQKINENLKAANYSESVVGNLTDVMEELQDKVSTIYTGHHEIIESGLGASPAASANSSTTMPPSSGIVSRPPLSSEEDIATGVINTKSVVDEASLFDEFTILEETAGETSDDDESLYVEETIVEEDEGDSYNYGFPLSDEVSAITQATL